jgi:hypothetical protein
MQASNIRCIRTRVSCRRPLCRRSLVELIKRNKIEGSEIQKKGQNRGEIGQYYVRLIKLDARCSTLLPASSEFQMEKSDPKDRQEAC